MQEQNFPPNEKKILINCEDGEVEYDKGFMDSINTEVISIDEFDELTGEFMLELHKKYKPKRVFIEFNGVWSLKELFKRKKPKAWELFQIISLVDATTFDVYLQNMRSIFAEMAQCSELMIFNRCTDETPKSSYRRFAKGANPNIQVMFENTDGTTDDGVADEDLPYDVSAPVVRIKDEDYGVFYIDTFDHSARYEGKTLSIRGMVYRTKDMDDKSFFLCRRAMTCCVDDIQAAGFICKYAGASRFKTGQWISAEVKYKVEYDPIYKEEGPVLYAKKIVSAEDSKPKDDLVTFN